MWNDSLFLNASSYSLVILGTGHWGEYLCVIPMRNVVIVRLGREGDGVKS
jgi:hypothetical protein